MKNVNNILNKISHKLQLNTDILYWRPAKHCLNFFICYSYICTTYDFTILFYRIITCSKVVYFQMRKTQQCTWYNRDEKCTYTVYGCEMFKLCNHLSVIFSICYVQVFCNVWLYLPACRWHRSSVPGKSMNTTINSVQTDWHSN